jgi:hypothetical protein
MSGPIFQFLAEEHAISARRAPTGLLRDDMRAAPA